MSAYIFSLTDRQHGNALMPSMSKTYI